MDWDILKVVIGVVIAVAGWLVGHYFSARREAAANRRKMVTGYLVDAYRKLNAFACVHVAKADFSPSITDDFNSAVGDVQLFGSPTQIQLVKVVAEFMAKKRMVHGDRLTALLHDLRNSLRKELDLASIDDPIAHLHVEVKEIEKAVNKMTESKMKEDSADE